MQHKNRNMYVIVRHAPGSQTLVWCGCRKTILRRKAQHAGYNNSGALWYEVRKATDTDDLTDVPHVEVAQTVILNR